MPEKAHLNLTSIKQVVGSFCTCLQGMVDELLSSVTIESTDLLEVLTVD